MLTEARGPWQLGLVGSLRGPTVFIPVRGTILRRQGFDPFPQLLHLLGREGIKAKFRLLVLLSECGFP